MTEPLKLELVGDTHVVVTRRFNASPEQVYRAHVEPELIQQWMLGPAGWTMPVCEHDGRVGGRFRYEWSNDEGERFALVGEFLELTPFSRIVHVERIEMAEMPGAMPDNHIETSFTPDGSGTLLTVRMTLPDAESRKAMLETGMEEGMEDSYARLDPLFADA